MEDRTCKSCGETKPLTKFNTTVSAGNGKTYYRRECRKCEAKRQQGWYIRNKDRLRVLSTERMRSWRAGLSPEKRRTLDVRAAANARNRTVKLRTEVYAAYGGSICACCGEREPKFLSVDHVNNDGYRHRKETGASGVTLYAWLVRQKRETGAWPKGFQILCMNCQHGKARNRGICPHQERRDGYSERK